MQIPEDFDSAPGKLGAVSFDPAEAVRRTPYGINEFGNRVISREDVFARLAYITTLDGRPELNLWVREFGRLPSEDEKAFGRWAIATGRVSTWEHALSVFFGCDCLQKLGNGALTTLPAYLAQQEAVAGGKGAPSGPTPIPAPAG
jgi:hypothetical protein